MQYTYKTLKAAKEAQGHWNTRAKKTRIRTNKRKTSITYTLVIHL